MNSALQKLLVMLALVSLPFLGWSQSVNLLTYQNTEIRYEFTSEPSSPSFIGGYLPENGTAEILELPGNWNHEFVYTPAENFIGTDNFRIRRWVVDPIPTYRILDVNVTVAPALIKAYHDYAVTYTNETVVVDVLANDISSNGVKVLQAVPAINHGSATFDQTTGLISFTPEPGFRGTAHFNYALCNGVGDCDDGTVSITVMEENPTTEDEVVEVFVKKNFTQFILVPDSYTLTQAPANGVFDGGADVPEYTPATDYTGTDEIVFNDGNHNLTFAIEVLDLETNSFAFDDRAFMTTNGEPLVIEVLENDLELTGCSLSLGSLGPANGDVALDGDVFTYTPDANFVGVDQFSYVSNVCGSGTTEEATVTVFVSNFAPDRTTFYMATPKQVPMIIGYNVPVETFRFMVTGPGELGETVFLPGVVDTVINGMTIQGNNILLYIPNVDVTEGLDEVEITYCLEDPANPNDCVVSKQVKVWMTILDVGDNGEPVCVGDCVWAGDTNADGIVNMNDLLPIGRSMGEIGEERVGATMDEWYGQYGEDWNSLFGGAESFDVKHIDADGNSIVTAEDTVAIRSFYGRTHNMVPDVMPYAPYEFILEGPLFVNPGDYVEFTISVGSPETPAEDIYGFVFPFTYNTDAVDPESINVTWDDNNFMAYDSPVLYMDHNDYVGKFDAGYTRTSGLVASGHGQLGTLGIVIDDLNGFRSDEKEIILHLGGDSGSSLDQFGNYHSVYVRPFQLRIVLNEEEEEVVDELNPDLLKTYPNPTNQYLSVHLNGQQEFEQVTLRTLTGQTVQHQNNLNTNHTTLNVSTLVPGIYILSVTSEKGTINRKIEVMR